MLLRLVVRIRQMDWRASRRLFQYLDLAHGRGQLDTTLRPGGLRWGVEFADRRRVTTLDESPLAAGPPDGVDHKTWLPDNPTLEYLARPVAWSDTWSRQAWLWPLPPPGALRVVCAWADRDIPETAVYVDATSLREAAGSAAPLWA